MTSVTLQPEISRGKNALAIVLIAAFWNGITYPMFGVFLMVSDAQDLTGWGGVAFYGFFGVFILIGVVLVVVALRSLLTLRYAPLPVLTLSAATVPVGDAANLSWRIEGRRDRVQGLTVSLEGKEEVQYISGTDTATDRHVFHQVQLYDSGGAPPMTEGRGRIAIPANTMWSWDARNNKIVWLVRIKMRLAGLPGTNECYRFTVVPEGGGR
jgi:hypothetical protein